jgi:hypothetical protein
MCPQKRNYSPPLRTFSVYSINKTGGRRKMFITRANLANLSVAQHLLSPFSSPFFGVNLLYDYGFKWLECLTANVDQHPPTQWNLWGGR